MASDLASWLRWALALSCVLWLWTSPPCWGGFRCYHVPYGFRPRLPTQVGSDAAMCPMTSDLTSRLRWAPTLPRVLWLRTSPPGWGGLRCCQVSYSSGPRLPVEVGFGAVTNHVAPCGPWASSIKKSLAVIPMQLGTYVPNARAQVFKALDIRVIMGLQDVRAGSAVNACKTCRQGSYNATTVQRQHYILLVWHRYSVKWFDSTTPHYWLSVAWQVTRPGMSTTLKTSFAAPSH
jgi:hypothetical protein